jgi:hypothetical protein
MRFSPFIVVCDANVLYPNALRDLLIHLAQADIFQAKWSDRILDEMFNALRPRTKNKTIPEQKLAELRRRMNMAIRDVRVDNYDPLSGRWLFLTPMTVMCSQLLSKRSADDRNF